MNKLRCLFGFHKWFVTDRYKSAEDKICELCNKIKLNCNSLRITENTDNYFNKVRDRQLTYMKNKMLRIKKIQEENKNERF